MSQAAQALVTMSQWQVQKAAKSTNSTIFQQ